MSELTTQLLTLFFVLLGLGIILSAAFGGQDGPKKLLGCLFLPIKLMGLVAFVSTLLVILVIVVLLILLDFWRSPDQASQSGLPSAESIRDMIPSPTPRTRYKALRQTDRSIYADNETYQAWNQTACLPTVYLMLLRGDHDPHALLDASWFSVTGEALKPAKVNFRLNTSANSDWDYNKAYDPSVVIEEIRAGRPVVLHGIGGKPVTHWVLAVDLRGEPPEAIVYNDPWVGALREIPASATAPEFQGIRDCVVSWMRLMAEE
jgi:hypothetical protein